MSTPEQDDFFDASLPKIPDLETGDVLSSDPDSVEDVLGIYEIQDIPVSDEEKDISSPHFIDIISENITDQFRSYGWVNLSELTGERLIDLCNELKVEAIDESLIALEDVGFMLEHENYDARALDRPISLEDIEQAALQLGGVNSFQNDQTTEAYYFIGKYIKDPILTVPDLVARSRYLLDELANINYDEIRTIDEYDEQQAKKIDLQERSERVNKKINDLISEREVTARRERAFRRMRWLMRQDFMIPPLEDYLMEIRKAGKKPDFNSFAGAVAGYYSDEIVIVNNEQSGKGRKKKIPTTKMERKYKPGIVDNLLNQHLEKMAEQRPKSQNSRANEALMLKRLSQAKALCESIFLNDITDRIYIEVPLSKTDYEILDFVRHRLLEQGDTTVLDDFASFLPGSKMRDLESTDIDEAPLSVKFSGRSKNEILQEIDEIIEEHPDLNSSEISRLLKSKEQQTLSPIFAAKLANQALIVLVKLAHKEKHSVRNLLFS